jgi:hypothetical protein
VELGWELGMDAERHRHLGGHRRSLADGAETLKPRPFRE